MMTTIIGLYGISAMLLPVEIRIGNPSGSECRLLTRVIYYLLGPLPRNYTPCSATLQQPAPVSTLPPPPAADRGQNTSRNDE